MAKPKKSLFSKYRRLPVYLGMVVLILTLPLLGMKLTEKGNPISFLRARATVWSAVLSISPDKLVMRKGQSEDVNLLLNSPEAVGGVDIFLQYDPTKLTTTVDSISLGPSFEKILAPSVDPQGGKLSFSALSRDTVGIKDAVVGSVKFIALSEGETFVAYEGKNSRAVSAASLNNILSQAKGTLISISK